MEIGVAKRVLQKIACTQEQKKLLPPEVFEAHVASKVNVSTVVVPVNSEGEFYFIRRPSKKEHPSELWPNQWHLPGVTHMKGERLADALKRLKRTEGISFGRLVYVGLFEERYKERGVYLMRVFLTFPKMRLTNPKGKFFALKNIPWKKIIEAEREIILPEALKVYKEQRING